MPFYVKEFVLPVPIPFGRSHLMPYLPSRYRYTAEYHPRQRPSNTPYLSNTGVFTRSHAISHQRSPLLPISANEPNSSSWGFFDRLKNMWSWKDNGLSASTKTVLHNPLYLPSPSEFSHPRPAPLPPSAVDRVPYDAPYSRPPLRQNINIINKPRVLDISPIVSSIREGEEFLAREQPPLQSLVPRHSKRSRLSLSPRHNVRETRHQDDGARKRVRFSTESLPSKLGGTVMYRLPPHKTRCMRSRSNRFLPFADWVAYYCNNILTEDTCSKLVMTRIDEKLVAQRITSIFEEYFPRRNSVDSFEAPTATFLALWYLGRLFRRGIFCFSDVDALGAPEAVIRVFLLGLTIADKWLNDGSRRLKDWSKFCRLPLCSRTSVEKRALRMLDYNICITNLEWRDWLDRLEPSTRKFVSENFTHSTQITAKVALETLRREKTLEDTFIRGPLRPREVEISSESLYFLREDLLAD